MRSLRSGAGGARGTSEGCLDPPLRLGGRRGCGSEEEKMGEREGGVGAEDLLLGKVGTWLRGFL